MSQDLDAIALFVATIHHGSISRAAKTLGIAKSTLSRQLRQLEHHLGVRLLERSTRQLELTEAGQRLFEQASPHLDELQEIQHTVSALSRLPSGQLTIMVPQELFSSEIAELISEFMHQYPDINLCCTQYSGTPPTPSMRFDLLFILHDQPLPATDWIARPLMSIPQGLYLASGLYDTAPETLAALADFPCILQAEESLWYFRHGREVVAQPINGRLQLNSPDMQLQAAIRGLGVARLARYLAEPALRSERLSRLHLEQEPVAMQLSVLYRSRHLPLKTRLFLEHFQNQIGRLSSLL